MPSTKSMTAEDKARGTGRTTRQMESAPEGAIYAWPHRGSLPYARDLARHLGRGDLRVIAANHLRLHRGMRGIDVVVDHACDLDDEQRFMIDYIKRSR